MSKFSFIKKVKLNMKSTLIKQIALLCSIVVLLVMAVFGWLSTAENTVTATGVNVTLTSGGSLQISLDGGNNWLNSIDLLADSDQKYISPQNQIKGNLRMEDITSDGKTFYRPVFDEENGLRIPNTDENWDAASKNRSYIAQTVTFRTAYRADIFLGSGTKIITSCEKEGKELMSYDSSEVVGNLNTKYQDLCAPFSNDFIVGALRISAYNSENDTEPRFVCIPRSDVLFFLDEDGNPFPLMNEEIPLPEDAADLGIPNVLEHKYYSTNYQTEGEPVVAENVIYNFDEPQIIATTEYNESTGYYEAQATINIWLEGCDSETTRALAGGKFQIALDFLATDSNTPLPEEPPAEDVE